MKKAISIIIILVLLSGLSACEAIRNNIKEESVERIVGKILGEEVDVTIINQAEDTQETSQPQETDGILDGIIENEDEGEIGWPEELPSNVPRFDLDIKTKIKTPSGLILDYGVVEINKVKEYADILKQYSYEAIREDISEKRFDALYQKEETKINVYWYSDGGFSLMITWD